LSGQVFLNSSSHETNEVDEYEEEKSREQERKLEARKNIESDEEAAGEA
jgi:hypothetical protein